MIDLGRPALYADGVTLFPDHARRDLLHYLSARPRLRVRPDGKPDLQLFKYRLDPALHDTLGAGLLSLGVDLSVEEETLSKLRARAARMDDFADRVHLSPVSASDGACELVLIDTTSTSSDGDDSPLVEKILGAETPALFGANAASFHAVLSAEGVALVEGALRQGGLPAGVLYELRTPGLRPAVRAEIVAHWRQIYEFFEARMHGGKLLAAVDIGPTMEELRQRELLEIRIDEFVPADERSAAFDRSIDQAQRYVVEKFFKPTLGTRAPADPTDDSALETIGRTIKDLAGLFSIEHSLRDVDRSELKTLRYQLHAARAEELTLAPQATLADFLAEGQDVEELIIEVEPAASEEMRFDVGTAIDLEAEGIDHLEAVLTYGDEERRVVLDAGNPSQDVVFWHEASLGAGIEYRFDAHLKPSEHSQAGGVTGVVSSPLAETDHRVLRLNPRTLYASHPLRVLAQGVPFERYPRVLVDLRISEPLAEWTLEETLELTAESPETRIELRTQPGSRIAVDRRLRYLETDGGEIAEPWESVDGEFVVVPDPLPEVVDLLILGSARFGSAVQRLIVELRPTADPGRVETRILDGDTPSANWSWQPDDGESRDYEYRVTVHTSVGEMRESPWQPGPAGKLVVGEGGQVRPVQVLFVGRQPSDLGLLALKLKLSYEDEVSGVDVSEEFLVQDVSGPIDWAYPAAHPDRQAYSWELTLIHGDGRVEVRDPVRTSDRLAIIPLV